MENSIISEYYKTIFDKMKTDKLLGENGETLLLSKDDFCQYCDQIIRECELETLRSDEYSCAVEPLFRRNGNRVSGTWEPPL